MTELPLHWIDLLIVASYLVFALIVGLVFARRAGSSMAEFFISGRTMPWWLAGTSMVATSFASDTPLVITGWVRLSGIEANWLWWSMAVGGMFSVFLLSRLWRRAEVVTDVELTELRYSGRSAAALRGFRAAYLALPINCMTMAWVVVAMMKLLDVLFGMNATTALVTCLVLATFYSAMSGYWGVVVTDFVQFIIAMVGSIVLSVIVVTHLGGLAGLADAARNASTLGERLIEFFPAVPDNSRPWQAEFWTGPVFAFAVFIAVQWWANKNADGGGVVVQRMSSTKDERHSLLATLWFNIANYALRPWPWILVALASVAIFPELDDGELAYPMMVKRFMPVGLLGLMVTSFLAAFMSTVDTTLNLSSSYLVNDVYRRFIAPDAPEADYVRMSRVVSVALMVISGIVAWQSESISVLFKFMLAFSSGVGGVYILRWFWWRINAWSEISAMVASSIIASCLYAIDTGWSYPQILVVTVAGSTVVWVVTTFITSPVERDKLVAFYTKVRPVGSWGPVARDAGIEPAGGFARGIVGWLAGTVMVLGATVGVGKVLVAEPLDSVPYLIAAAVGTIVVWGNLTGMKRR